VEIKDLHTQFFAINKPVELTYHKAGLLMQYPQKYQAKKSDEVPGSKGGKRKIGHTNNKSNKLLVNCKYLKDYLASHYRNGMICISF
jgi:hypothetical protein